MVRAHPPRSHVVHRDGGTAHPPAPTVANTAMLRPRQDFPGLLSVRALSLRRMSRNS